MGADRQLNVAVVGCGAAGRFHCDAITQLTPEMRLVGVVDAMVETGTDVARKYGVPFYPSCRALLEAKVAEAVTLATPHPVHAETAIECMDAGLGVITEKPLADSVAAADRMLKAAQRNRVAFACVFQLRHEPLMSRALEIARSGQLGSLLRATLITRDFRTQAYYDSNGWRATWKGEGGGVLLNQAPHWLDLMMQMTGLPAAVRGRLATRLHDIEVEDHAEALLTFVNGGTGYILCSTNEPAEGNHLEITGTRGRMILREGSLELAQFNVDLAEFAGTSTDMWGRPESTTLPVPIEPVKCGHFSVFRNFARHVLQGEPLLCSAESALASLDLANAVILSHFSGREVKLPTNRRAYSRLLAGLQAKSPTCKKNVKVQFVTDPTMK